MASVLQGPPVVAHRVGPRTNLLIAERLRETAEMLHYQHANPHRIRAYLNAAETVSRLREPVSEILDRDGREGLERLPGIGESIARSIQMLVVSGRLPMLERLRGEADPVAILQTVPGIGPKTAVLLHEDLNLDSLEDLEAAAHDGRLASIAAIGPKRLGGIRDCLATRLGRFRGEASAEGAEPSVAELLSVDTEYRRAAAEGRLRKIAPKRFNPSGTAWLPILHPWDGWMKRVRTWTKRWSWLQKVAMPMP